ncbi:MAG: hybrid sensor histidine kinase/response regulator [Candidatus Parabeggiatoa sp.]|nr:hybrid sensor histidine kinase/response regulator [Candidatus Parabeggiatoa sp.]
MSENETIVEKSGNILVVDDTAANLRLLTKLLSDNGYEVRPAPNGTLALKSVALILPDLILLDIMMPDLDGYEVCRRLKASEHSRDIPIIFISAINETMDKVKAFNIGGIDYITKPFEADEVLARVKTHLTVRLMQKKVAEKTDQLHAKVEELIQTRQELVQSEKMASLGRLVAGFAHELNTPIGVAVGAASSLHGNTKAINKLLEQEEVDEDELVETLETINEAADLTLSNLKRAANLVSSFKRTAIDQTSEEMRHFQVKTTLDDVINTLHNQFKQTAIEIQVDCPDDLAVYSLPGALEQILTNLMMNSLIHGFSEGKEAGHITIAVTLLGKDLHLAYSDTGKGLKPDTVEKIFEPFFTTHRAHGGSGLGLYICYNLVKTQLRGTITCESSPGKGVLFKMNYPINTDLYQ